MARSRQPFWHGSISLPQVASERIKELAAERGSSFADVIRTIVHDYLRRLDQQQRKVS